MTTRSDAPRIYVTVEPAKNAGSGAAADLSLKVLSLEYEESEKKVDKCVLTLDNATLEYFDHPVFEKGTRLRVSWGYAGRMSPVRAVVVQKVTGALTLKVEAQGAGVLMNKVARTRTFENTTRSELVHALAKENGFGDAERHVEETSRVIPVQTQAGQTDFQFLKRLAELEGFEFYVDFDGLHWHPRRLAQKPVRVFQYYLPPGVGDITGFDIDNDVTAKPGAAVVKGRDPLKKTDVSAQADDKTTPRTTLGGIGELLGIAPPDGKDNAKATTATNLPGEVLEVNPKTGETKTVIKPAGAASGDVKNTSDPANAKTEAAKTFTKAQQAVVQLKLNLVGDPHLVAKTVVEVRGLGQRLSGKYFISDLKHKVDSSGYVMEAKSRTDGTNKGTPQANSKAKPNTKQGDAKGANDGTLTETVVVNPKTGEEKTIYKDTRGREN